MEGGRPWALGASGCTVLQHGVELGLDHGQAIWGKAARTAGCRRAGCCPDLVCSAVPHLTIVTCWFCQPRKFLQEFVWGRASCNNFHTGDCWWRDAARCRQRCNPIEQAVVPVVDEESIMGEQVHTYDEQLHVRNDKTPCEVAAQPHVQAP